MNRLILIGIVIILSVMLLIGCAEAPSEDETTNYEQIDFDAGIYYYYDSEHDVCIWVYDGYKAGGIFVLPSSEVENPTRPMNLEKYKHTR